MKTDNQQRNDFFDMTRNRLMLLVYFQPFSDLNWVTTLFFPEWVFCYTFNGLYGRVLINNIIQKEMDFCVVTAAVEYVEKRENIFPFSLFNPFIIWWCILLSWFSLYLNFWYLLLLYIWTFVLSGPYVNITISISYINQGFLFS